MGEVDRVKKCGDCQAYALPKWHCHRFPQTVEKLPDDWCMEFAESVTAREMRESETLAEDAKVKQENIDKSYDERQAQSDASWPPTKELEKEVIAWDAVEPKKAEEKVKAEKAKESEPAHVTKHPAPQKGKPHKR
jgi:hypothetical protein